MECVFEGETPSDHWLVHGLPASTSRWGGRARPHRSLLWSPSPVRLANWPVAFEGAAGEPVP